MIFYFSGLGNTCYAAKTIAGVTSEPLHFIPDTGAESIEFKGESLGILFPVYSWGVPPLVLDFFSKLSDKFIETIKKQDIPVWAVMTCGDETGNAPDMLKSHLNSLELDLKGVWSVIMPNTYVLLPGFDVDKSDVEEKKLDEAVPRIKEIANKIKNKEWDSDVFKGSMPGFKTGALYPLFKKLGIFPKRWRWTQECVKCGKCAEVCPIGNIHMSGNHPVWGKECVSCLACYHNCPTHAIEYANMTEHKGQYVCPLGRHS